MANITLKLTDILSPQEIERIISECKAEFEHIKMIDELLNLSNIKWGDDN